MKRGVPHIALLILILLGLSIYFCREDAKILGQERENGVFRLCASRFSFSECAPLQAEQQPRSGLEIRGSPRGEAAGKSSLADRGRDGKSSFLRCELPERGGFVLLAADKRVNSILGFSHKRAFSVDVALQSPGLSAWIRATREKIEDVRRRDTPQGPAQARAWAQLDSPGHTPEEASTDKSSPIQLYAPPHLLHTNWGQGCGYNVYLHDVKDCDQHCGKALASALNLAMAQLMKYYAHPEPYNWSAMTDGHSTAETARLIGDVHKALDTHHAIHSSCNATWIDFTKVYRDLAQPPQDHFHTNFCDENGYDEGWYRFDKAVLSRFAQLQVVYALRP